MENKEVPVLIAGGSLVGMSTAMLLGGHRIESMVVERHPGAAIHPRAAFIMQRSMEIFRGAGIEDQVRESSYAQFEADGAIMSVETLVGKELAWHIRNLNDGVRDLSPSERLFVTQIGLEPVLCARAEELGAEVLFGTELVDCEQDAHGVTAVIRDRANGQTSSVRSQYLVAADGPRSPMRERLGIAMTGRGVFSKAITIYFRADVESLLRERNLSVVLVMNETFAGFFRIEKPYRSGFLVVHSVGDPKNPVTDVWDLDEQRCVDLVHAGLGTDAVDVTIEDVMQWQAMADVAESFQDGRIFLAGDAAHVMPPYGGYGGNTGIHDAHNLAWKLAAGARRRGLAGAAGHLRSRASAGCALHGRAGLRALRDARGAVSRRRWSGVDRRRPRDRSRCSLALGRDRCRVQRRSRLCRPSRVARGTGHARASSLARPRRRTDLDAGPRRHGFVLLAGRTPASGRRPAVKRGSTSTESVRPAPSATRTMHSPRPTGSRLPASSLVRPDGFVAWRAVDAAGASAQALTDALDTALCRTARRQ